MNDNQLDRIKKIYQSVISSDLIADPVNWVFDNVRSPESARSSSIDLRLTPYLVEPFLTAVNGCNEKGEPIHEISILGNTGSGKSTFYVSFLNFALSQRPAPTAVIFQNAGEAMSFGESRLFPTLKGNPKLKEIYPDDRKHARKMQVDLAGTPLYLLAATKGQLQSKSLTYLVLDECWAWGKGMIGEALRRTHDRQNRLVISTSQGGIIGDDWQKYHAQGVIKEFAYICPHCQKPVVYDWKNLHWEATKDDDEKIDLTALEESIYFQCPFCNSKFEDTVSNRRLLAESGKYVEMHDNSKLESHVSYHYNALACYWISWKTLILEFLEANDYLKETGDRGKLNQFFQKRLANNINLKIDDESTERIVCFRQAHKKINVESLIEGIEKCRLLAVDVQGDGFFYSVYAFCNNGKLYLMDAGKVQSYKDLEDIQKHYKVDNQNVVLDCAYNTNEVVYQCNIRKWYAVNMTSSQSFLHTINNKKVDLLYSVPQYMIVNSKSCGYLKGSSRGMKEYTYQNFIKKKNVIIYDDVDKFFIRSLTAEVRVPYKDNLTQTIKYRWEAKSNISHYWDCLCECVLMLMIRKQI